MIYPPCPSTCMYVCIYVSAMCVMRTVQYRFRVQMGSGEGLHGVKGLDSWDVDGAFVSCCIVLYCTFLFLFFRLLLLGNGERKPSYFSFPWKKTFYQIKRKTPLFTRSPLSEMPHQSRRPIPVSAPRSSRPITSSSWVRKSPGHDVSSLPPPAQDDC